MAYPKILQRLFEDFGAGPKLRGDILPFGSKEGTACEGDDARLSNARVPETHNETHKTGGTDPLTPADIGAHPADGMASTDKAGIVRLSSATDMDSEDQASTPKAVKTAYELADTAKSMAAEAQGKADAAYEKATLDATTDVAGRTQLSSEVDSDREDMAATPRAVKSVHDKAIEAASAASAAQALAASAESTATAAKTNADKVPEISTQVKALEDKVQTATPDDLGMVRIGQGISVDETGLISIQSGIFQVGEGLELSKEGVLSASTFPVGGIIFWSGAANAIPRGWALCDGKNGTPNLQDKFVLGAGSTYNIGDTGGSTNITVSGTVGSTTIISSQMPKHSHSIYSNTGSQVGVTNGVNNSGANPATVTTSEAGGNMPHTHAATLTAEGDVLPPYYVLAYIMKI